MFIYNVSQGDNLNKISRRYNVPVKKIVEDNQLKFPDKLVAGQSLLIDAKPIEYIVKSGDSLYSIASRYNITVKEILNANKGLNTAIRPGQRIIIKAEGTNGYEVNGYAYAKTPVEVLEFALPY